ncbi:hypothetical protein V6N12_058437 [Hibiscus sabdariffa]|uniref:Uncharacterized protein n=1 Tax=Hibiscus sabdariffa TaxID=183260 RepID=A0ABR2EUR7_9ROSI
MYALPSSSSELSKQFLFEMVSKFISTRHSLPKQDKQMTKRFETTAKKATITSFSIHVSIHASLYPLQIPTTVRNTATIDSTIVNTTFMNKASYPMSGRMAFLFEVVPTSSPSSTTVSSPLFARHQKLILQVASNRMSRLFTPRVLEKLPPIKTSELLGVVWGLLQEFLLSQSKTSVPCMNIRWILTSLSTFSLEKIFDVIPPIPKPKNPLSMADTSNEEDGNVDEGYEVNSSCAYVFFF